MERDLPERFLELQQFADVWALDTMSARHARRVNSSSEERTAFYDAMAPRLDEVLGYLNQFPVLEMPLPERNLLHLTYALAEIALSIEVYNPVAECEHSESSRRVQIIREIDS